MTESESLTLERQRMVPGWAVIWFMLIVHEVREHGGESDVRRDPSEKVRPTLSSRYDESHKPGFPL